MNICEAKIQMFTYAKYCRLSKPSTFVRQLNNIVINTNLVCIFKIFHTIYKSLLYYLIIAEYTKAQVMK